MVGILTVLVILLFLGGIILFNMKSATEEKPREDFLNDLAGFLGGSLELIKADSNEQSFRILFRYKDQEFIYEDIEAQGFKNKIYKAYLKTKTPSRFTLVFSEKEHSIRVRTDIFIASEVSTQRVDERIELQVPKFLQGLKVTTNDLTEANRFFSDHKVSSVFKKYQNTDTRGYLFLVIGITQGEVVLEFSADKACFPNVSALKADPHSIDNHLERIMTLVHKLKGES